MLIPIIAVIAVLSIMILSHELGHFLMAKRMGVKVEAFSLGFGPRLWSIKKGDTVYTLSLIPIGGYVKMAGEEPGEEHSGAEWEFSSKPVSKRFGIIAAGSVVNYILGFVLFSLVFMVGAPMQTSRIGGVLEGYPAEKIGLKENDKIIEINKEKVEYWEEVQGAIYDSEGKNITLQVERSGRILNFKIKGKTEEVKDIFGKPKRQTLIGISPSDETVSIKYPVLEAISTGGRTVLKITTLTYRFIWGMITGSVSMKMVGGPISIVARTGKAAKAGISNLLWMSGLISVSLAIFNLLPFPILDGGHILFLGIEKIKGSPVSRKTQEIVQQVALVLLVMFLLVVSWNDVMRFFK